MTDRLLAEYFDLEPELLPGKYLDQIEDFTRKIIPVSGGVDSAAIAIAMKNLGYDCELLWNDTRRSMKTARQTLCDLMIYTGWPLTILYPYCDMRKLHQETKRVAYEIIFEDREYNKSAIPCCYHLKEAPMIRWLKKETWETVVISGIAPYESNQRRLRLAEIRKRGTYLRYKKKEKCWFAYPLRDFLTIRHGKLVSSYANHYLESVEPSGCRTCPVLAMWKIPDVSPDRVARSKKVYAKAKTA